MLSKFGKNDGGREVWAYNFLPVLLQDEKIKLNIFGYRTKEEDNTQLLVKLDKSNVSQVEAILVTGKNNIFPKFLSMFLSLKKL